MIELPEPVTTAIDGAIEFVYSFQPYADQTVVLGARPGFESYHGLDSVQSASSVFLIFYLFFFAL